MSCFDNIVGITRRECECLPPVPEGASNSLSGLYLDELAPLSMLDFSGSCETGSIWDIFTNARQYGTLVFKSDVNTALYKRYDPTIKRFVGGVGLATGFTNTSTTDTYVGARWRIRPTKGGSIKINAIGTLFPPGTTTGTRTLTVYNSLNQVIATRIVNVSNSGANTVTVLTEPIVLPTFIEFAEKTEYFFLYTNDPLQPSRQNKTTCCGRSKTFEPPFAFQNNATDWSNWLFVGGYTTSVLDRFGDTNNFASVDNLFGLTFSIEIGCNTDAALCRGVFDFSNDPLAMSIALGVQFASALKAGSDVLASKDLSRTTMINRTLLTDTMKEWREQYNGIVAYLRDNLTLEDNDCFTCKDTGIKIETIATAQRRDHGNFKRVY